MEAVLNSFQEDLATLPDVTFMGATLKKSIKTNADASYNLFEIKSTGFRFGLDQSAFSGMVPGKRITSIHPELEGKIDPSANWIWLWPWDIVRILNTLSPYASTIFNQPKAVMEFLTNVDEKKVTPGFARQISSDTTTWSNFFTDLGSNQTFEQFWPVGATICRIIGGSGEPMPAADTVEVPPEPTDKILKTIALVAVTVGLVTAETIAVGIGIFAIIGTACTIAASTLGISAPACAWIAGILITLLVIGWIVLMICEIINMIIQGILIWW